MTTPATCQSIARTSSSVIAAPAATASVPSARRSGPAKGAKVPAAIGNSLLIGALAALAVTALAMPIAVMLVRYPGKLSRMTERLTYVGYALPGIVIALAFVFMGARFMLPIYQTLPLLVLAIGVVVVDAVHEEQSAAELAEVDSALLTDDVPLVAYADRGFGVYLKNTRR